MINTIGRASDSYPYDWLVVLGGTFLAYYSLLKITDQVLASGLESPR